MGVSISIKNVPAEKVELLKRRAKRNHRSLQGELHAIVDQAIGLTGFPAAPITIDELAGHGRRLGLKTPSESVKMIREDRDR
ncbi:MAG: Arc family DNA-binding protein [Proteobacteria bacterium]|nr:Arc family DNA-binding protein [Pseudomonadota bacterium]